MLAAVPDARFRVVGRAPHARVARLASDSVEIVGRVPRSREHLHGAAVFVVPLRIGGGTRLKIYEAMGAAKAVVSTTIGAEGLDVRDGHDVLLADTPDRFAGSVIALLNDPTRRRQLEIAPVKRRLATTGRPSPCSSRTSCAGRSTPIADRRGSIVRRGCSDPGMRVLVLDGNENHAVAAVRSLARAGHQRVRRCRYGLVESGLVAWRSGSIRLPLATARWRRLRSQAGRRGVARARARSCCR